MGQKKEGSYKGECSKRSNYVMLPNRFFDEIMPILPQAELKCLLYIIRRTMGFNKKSDEIGYSQFEFGIKNKDGEQLDNGCGVCKKSISTALYNLNQMGLILIDYGRKAKLYTVNEHYILKDVISWLEYSKFYHTTMVNITTLVWYFLHIQYTEKEREKKNPNNVRGKSIREETKKVKTNSFLKKNKTREEATTNYRMGGVKHISEILNVNKYKK